MLASIGTPIASLVELNVYCGFQVFGGIAEGYFNRNIVNRHEHSIQLFMTRILQVGLAGIYLAQLNIATVLLSGLMIIPFGFHMLTNGEHTFPKVEIIVSLFARLLNIFFQTVALTIKYGNSIGLAAGVFFIAVQLFALKPRGNCREGLAFLTG